jgi:hypothetical protein
MDSQQWHLGMTIRENGTNSVIPEDFCRGSRNNALFAPQG